MAFKLGIKLKSMTQKERVEMATGKKMSFLSLLSRTRLKNGMSFFFTRSCLRGLINKVILYTPAKPLLYYPHAANSASGLGRFGLCWV